MMYDIIHTIDSTIQANNNTSVVLNAKVINTPLDLTQINTLFKVRQQHDLVFLYICKKVSRFLHRHCQPVASLPLTEP